MSDAGTADLPHRDPGALTAAALRPLVGEGLVIAHPGLDGAHTLTLVAVEERPEATPPGAPRTGFRLVLRGAADAVLPQATYTIGHPDLGQVALFMVPVGPVPGERGAADYEIIMN
ncbi:DUF6916 family protein [Roseospira goensis]|uniref:DUF6916 domain-containing protein n=1 Tax=Roseospira goensis TaxID=391922 RepID=A0A7W6S0A4_9PROT|nr:hypothetical protein [Roseospira goensis]MBB4286361.1 hypothetical protein [Roseospira goensis]